MNFKTKMKKIQSILFNKKNNDHNRTLALFGGLMIYFCLAGYSIWGYINVYIISYFHSMDEELTVKNTNLILTLSLSPMLLTPIFSIQLAEKIGFKNLIRFTTLLFSISVIISSYQSNFYTFIFFYGFLCTWAVGFSLNPIIYIIWSFYPNQKGKITGILFGMFSITPTIMVPIISAYLNPENHRAEKINGNVYFSENVYENVPNMIFYLGVFYLAWSFVGASLFHEPSKNFQITKNEHVGLNEVNSNDDEINALEKSETISPECMSLKQGFLSKPFVIIFFCSFFLALYGFYLTFNFKSYGLLKINDDHFVTIVAMLNGIAAFFGRITFGHILDKTSFYKLFIVLEVLLALFSFTFAVVSDFPYLYGIWSIIISCLDSGILCIIAPGFTHIFGFEIGSRLYPYAHTSFYISMILAPLLQIILMKFLTLDQLFYLFGIGNIFASGLATLLKRNYDWK